MNSILPEGVAQLKRNYPEELLRALADIGRCCHGNLYLVGGSVRDCLLGRDSNDLDIAVTRDADACAKKLIHMLGYGTFVDISGPDDEAGRVVLRDIQVDFASFRGGATTIEEDLRLRDFTCNSMALRFDLLVDGCGVELIDPMSGYNDLKNGKIRRCPAAFEADPVRMLRGYRLCARLDFSMDEETVAAIRKHADLINNSAVERIGYELKIIFESVRTSRTIREMAETNLLATLLPEIYLGAGVVQPGFHHLDVLGHCLLALEKIEEIIADPGRYYPDQEDLMVDYLGRENSVRCLKWAALMHDIGKPITQNIREDKGGRITFYNHDRRGAVMVDRIGERLKWGRADKKLILLLIEMHMHPFHLCNVQRRGRVSRRAALKLCRRAGNDLAGLFLLAMSDSLAGSGEMKPVGMEEELGTLLKNILIIYHKDIRPVLTGPRLLTGRDLIKEFALTPGPFFSVVLSELEVARVEGKVYDRESALAWVDLFLKEVDAEKCGCN